MFSVKEQGILICQPREWTGTTNILCRSEGHDEQVLGRESI